MNRFDFLRLAAARLIWLLRLLRLLRLTARLIWLLRLLRLAGGTMCARIRSYTPDEC